MPLREGLSEHVLVVEDDEDNRFLLKICLEDMGLVVDTAEDGDQAIDRIDEISYDMVVTDLKLPGPDGFAVARHLKAERPEVAVILLTAMYDAPETLSHETADIDATLRKPFLPEVLEAAVRALLRGTGGSKCFDCPICSAFSVLASGDTN